MVNVAAHLNAQSIANTDLMTDYYACLGNAFPGIAQYNEFLHNLPSTSHDVQSFDCHPIPGIAIVHPTHPSSAYKLTVAPSIPQQR